MPNWCGPRMNHKLPLPQFLTIFVNQLWGQIVETNFNQAHGPYKGWTQPAVWNLVWTRCAVHYGLLEFIIDNQLWAHRSDFIRCLYRTAWLLRRRVIIPTYLPFRVRLVFYKLLLFFFISNYAIYCPLTLCNFNNLLHSSSNSLVPTEGGSL